MFGCRVELAKCIANPSCAANVACLNTCNNRLDETECQVTRTLDIIYKCFKLFIALRSRFISL